MKLTGAEIANSEGSKFTQDVTCPWCLTASRLDLGPQHVHGDLTLHCRKCAKFSRHKTADRWFDQHQERMEELKDVWKKIPNDAYVSCRQSMRGTPFVYTVSLGGTKRGEEFMSRDIVCDILTAEYGMSYMQAHRALMSAALTPGQRIYLQRHTRLVMAATERDEMRRTGEKEWIIPTGTQIRVNGQDGLFLRYSGNEGFAIVALPTPGIDGFGDAEVPIMDLEVVDAGGPEVAEDFQFDKEMDEGLGEEGEETGGLEEALEHIEVAEEIVEDLVLEEGGPSEAGEQHAEEHAEEHEETEHEFEEAEGKDDEGGEEGVEEGSEKPPFAARRKAAMPGAPRSGVDPGIDQKLRSLQAIIQDPNTDPQTLAEAQRQWTQLKRQVPASRNAAKGDYKCVDCGAKNPKFKSPCSATGDLHTKPAPKGTWSDKKAFFGYRTEDDMAAMERPKHKTVGPKLTDTKLKGDSWVPRNEDENPQPKEDTNLNKTAGRFPVKPGTNPSPRAQKMIQKKLDQEIEHIYGIHGNGVQINIMDIGKVFEAGYQAYLADQPLEPAIIDVIQKLRIATRTANAQAQRRVHTHFAHSGDLKRAIDVNRDDLSIEDIRVLCKFFANTGKIAHYEANELAFWFIGDKPRLLCASDITAASDCTCEGAYDRYCPEHGAKDSKRSREDAMGSNKRQGRGALSLRDLRVSAKDAGEAEVPDAHPESGASSGSGATSTPDPKRQSGESANSVTGPEKVRDHGTGDSPKDSGDVKTPDLGVPKGASMRLTADEEDDDDGHSCNQCGGPLVPLGSLGKRKHYRCRNCGAQTSKKGMRKRADGTCQKCGTPLNQAGMCPTCNSSAEQQQAQDSPMAPTTALSKSDLDKRKGARHKDGCPCGFCSRMKENSDWSKSRGKEKSALSTRDMQKVAHDEVGIFMPANHNGTRVLVIAVDNTSLRATVQDGEGNQRQVDFADLEPVKVGPYSGMAKKPDPGAR
jgi:hypothetical protein